MLSTASRIWLLVLLLQRFAGGLPKQCMEDPIYCSVGLCSIPECSVCNDVNAVCQTESLEEPIPLNLHTTTMNILLYYVGQPATLKGSMFTPYKRLANVTVYGNFVAIASGTFHNHRNLACLFVKNTQISSLPSDLFHDSSLLHHLLLPNNKLIAIPEQLFHSLSRVTHLDFSFNPIDICNMSSIGKQFANLSKLLTVKLAGLGSNQYQNQNCTLGNDFLEPLAHIQVLHVSESNILHRNRLLLKPLIGLTKLYINKLEPYKSCPSLANEFFSNFPPNVATINAENWKTNHTMSTSCALNKASFIPFVGSKLGSLNLRYSDKILGDKLTADMFEGINIKVLDLTWCRLTTLAENAFDLMKHLTILSLEGNQLGPRLFKLFTTPESGLKLNTLRLANVGAFSDDDVKYPIGGILENSPNIQILLMHSNFMAKLPRFSVSRATSVKINQKLYQIFELGLNDNKLSDLSANVTKDMCTLMPNLTLLNAEKNLLTDITGLCLSVRDILLGDNKIGTDEDRNLQAVKHLVHLRRFDMRRNGIKQLPHDLLLKMSSLEFFLMGGNDILTIPENLFMRNTRLVWIDLSSNLLTSIDTTMFSSSDLLAGIHMQSNLLTKIPKEITHRLDVLANTSNKALRIFEIADNPFDCSCGNEYLQKWVQTSKFVANVRQLNCSDVNPQSRIGNFVYNYTRSTFYCTWQTPAYIGGSALLAIILSLPLGISVYRNRWYITHFRVVARAMAGSAKRIKMEEQSKYDAFISYDVKNDAHNIWIMRLLIPEIEGKTIQEACGGLPTDENQVSEDTFRLYIHERDSNIGAEKYTKLCDAVENSRKRIILLSNSYLASSACLNEANLLAGYETDKAQCYHPNRILILVLEELDEEKIRPPITGLLQLNVIDVTPSVRESARKMKSVWGRVRKFISRPNIFYEKSKTKKPVVTNTTYQQF